MRAAMGLSGLYCVQLGTASSPECSTCLLGAVPAGMGSFLPSKVFLLGDADGGSESGVIWCVQCWAACWRFSATPTNCPSSVSALCSALVPALPWGQQRRVGALSLCCRQMNGLLPHEQGLPGMWDPALAASKHSRESEDRQHPCRAPHECCCSSAWCPAVPLHRSSPGHPRVGAGMKRGWVCAPGSSVRYPLLSGWEGIWNRGARLGEDQGFLLVASDRCFLQSHVQAPGGVGHALGAVVWGREVL